MNRVISREYRNKPCPTCGSFTNRGPCIDALIIRDEKILLIKRAAENYTGYWALIGGYLEWDESLEDCVKREVKEEVGLDVTNVKLLNVYSDPERSPVQDISAAYVVEAFGEPKAGDDASDFQWCPLDNLPEEMAFDHKKIISEYLKRREEFG